MTPAMSPELGKGKHEMTRAEAKACIVTMQHACDYIERSYGKEGEVDMRPWIEPDNPVSLAHWILVQGKLDAIWAVRRLSDTPRVQRKGLRGIHTVKNGQIRVS